MMMMPPTAAAEPIVINLTPPEVTTAAGGEPIQIMANVRNASTTVDQYSIEIENIDPTWYTIMVQSVSLFPGDSADIPIKIHPPKGTGTRAGHHTFIVRGRSQADPSLIGVTKGVVVVASFANFTLDLAPKRFTGFRGKYRLGITNGGNAEAQIDLLGTDQESKLNFSFHPQTPTIPPGKKTVVPVTVKKNGFNLVGEPEKATFKINARPMDGTEKEAKEVEGEFVQKPLFKGWRLPLIILGLLLLGLIWVILKPDINPCSALHYSPITRVQLPWYASMLCSSSQNTLKIFEKQEKVALSNCQSGAGFTEVRTKYGSQIGACVEDEWYDLLGNAHQKTQKGELLYIQKGPESQIYFFSGEQIYTFIKCDKDSFNNCVLEVVAKETSQK